jgi:hypothetical protein
MEIKFKTFKTSQPYTGGVQLHTVAKLPSGNSSQYPLQKTSGYDGKEENQ